jgi:hypothetical protein
MDLISFSVSGLLGAGGALAAGLAVFAWKHRESGAATPVAALLAAAAIWSVAQAAELLLDHPSAKVWAARVEHIGIEALPVTFLLAALHISGRGEAVTIRRVVLLSAVPAATLSLVWTSDLQGLMWRSISVPGTGTLRPLVTERGPWFLVFVT